MRSLDIKKSNGLVTNSVAYKGAGEEKSEDERRMANFASYVQSLRLFFLSMFHAPIFRVNPFFLEFGYVLAISVLGILPFKIFKLRDAIRFIPSDLDLFFTSVSTVTVSSMAVVEIETFLNTQLVFMTLMMFSGGEVFVSLLRLFVLKAKTMKDEESAIWPEQPGEPEERRMRRNCIGVLIRVVGLYLLLVHVFGFLCVLIYVRVTRSAEKVLEHRGLNMQTFAIFTTASSFSNCGFAPTNENMMAFIGDSVLLLLLILLILMGNTLYPVFLRFCIWVLFRITKKPELSYMMKKPESLGLYDHLFSRTRCFCVLLVEISVVSLQLLLLLALDWNSISGLNSFQKIIAALFQVVNSRHAGESVISFLPLSLPVSVLTIVVMYLPSYTACAVVPVQRKGREEDENTVSKKGLSILTNFLSSRASFLIAAVLVICILEKEKIEEDPLNFNLLSISFEVISGYGNVGFSMGYSCKLRIHPENQCTEPWYGFVGKWSNSSKAVMILVMIYGKLKGYFH